MHLLESRPIPAQLLISVVIPMRNREDTIGDVLESLCNQTLSTAQFEVIVIDDGSSDKSVSIAKSYSSRLQLHLSASTTSRSSAAAARNQGQERATSEIVMFMDADIACDPRVLEMHVKIHKAVPGSVVLGYVNAQESMPVEWCMRVPHLLRTCPRHVLAKGDWKEHWWPDRRDSLQAGGDSWTVISSELSWSYCWTQLVSVEKTRCPSFNSGLLGKGGEDLEWGFRLHREGRRFVLAPRSRSIHCPHFRDRLGDIERDVQNYYAALHKNPCVAMEAVTGFDCGNAGKILPIISAWTDSWRNDDHTTEKEFTEYLGSGCSWVLMCGRWPEPCLSGLQDTWFVSPDAFGTYQRSSLGTIKSSCLTLCGYMLPFRDKYFDITCISSEYLALPEALLCRVFQEVLRVSAVVLIRIPKEPVARQFADISVPQPYWSKRYYCSTELDDFSFTSGERLAGSELYGIEWAQRIPSNLVSHADFQE